MNKFEDQTTKVDYKDQKKLQLLFFLRIMSRKSDSIYSKSKLIYIDIDIYISSSALYTFSTEKTYKIGSWK